VLTASPGNKKTDSGQLAVLGAFCLFLSAVEYMIPKPLPFLRIGLANLPIMIACDIFPLSSFIILVFIKIFGQALITGTLFSYIFLFSMTGTLLSAVFMYFLRRALGFKRITFIGIGTAGAVISNISQLALAYVFIFRENVRYIAPPFLAIGLITGIVLGFFCEIFIKRSFWYRESLSAKTNPNQGFKAAVRKDDINEKTGSSPLSEFYYNAFSAKALFAAGLIIMPSLLFNPSTDYRVVQFLFFLFLALLSGNKINLLSVFVITLFIIAFNLIIPYGKILFSLGAFKITSGALEAGVHRAVTLQALVMLSKAAVRNDLRLPGSFGQLLGESLRIFKELTDRKIRITGKNFTAKIDELMTELCRQTLYKPCADDIKTKPLGYLILAVVTALSWLPWIFNFNFKFKLF